MSESKRDLLSVSGEQDVEMEKLKVEFPPGRKVKVPRRDGTINDGQINGVHFSKRDQCWKIDVRFVDPKDKREKFKSITLEELKEFNKEF